MGTKVISRLQWVSIQCMSLPIIGHVLLIHPIIKAGGKDGWISALVSIPVGLLFAGTINLLKSYSIDTTLIKAAYETAGKVLAIFLSGILIGYFLFLSVATLRGFEEFMKVSFMPDTPLWAFGASLMLLVWFSLHRNIEATARVAVILFLLILITGSIVGLNLHQEKEYTRILPILENGWDPVVNATVYFISMWSELILISMLQTKWLGARHDFSGHSFVVIFNALLAALMVFGIISVFGLPLSETLDWPVQNEVRMLKFGFIDRGDIYGLFTMSAGCYIRVTVFLFAVCEIFSFWSSSYKLVTLPVCLLVLLLSIYAFHNHSQFTQIITSFYQYGYLIMGVPLLALVIFIITKRKTQVRN
ncbi:spore gernimation protein [Brevibacillus nitrificans]|uniref:Spore gernimation protein n=1 Tax=Brevibacillus nitrificans TaxID=651560 RepID=A0A3M8DMM7_9BACL|nr:endospore germination permease [Brevibacillus nitrificans]RNB89328.1 spore gernimation protein [Brevibacillus nitrificans]